jgi:hypothetical protein
MQGREGRPKISAALSPSATVRPVTRSRTLSAPCGRAIAAFALATAWGCASTAWGCASTELLQEGPGQPTDRASGAVPAEAIGVCRQRASKRPPIVNEKLWEDAPVCTERTPDRYLRLGVGAGLGGATTDAEADQNLERLLTALREGQEDEAGDRKLALAGAIRGLRDRSLGDPALRDRVARDAARAGTCDHAYLLSAMTRERAKLSRGDRCAAEAYDGKLRGEACLFDASRDEVVWLTSSFSCIAPRDAIGQGASCFRMCGDDDYCAAQVSCAAPDLDLLLCALGVCFPEPRAGIR